MDTKVGEIVCQNDYTEWYFKWSDIKKTRRHSAGSIESPNFTLEIGTCCFAIQLKTPHVGWEITYVLKLVKLSSTHISRPVQLRVDDLLKSEWTFDEEPRLEFRANCLRKMNNFLIVCEVGQQSDEDSSGIGIGGLKLEDLSIESNIPSDKETKVDDAPTSKSAAKLMEDLKEVLLSEKGSDVVLEVQGKRFNVHSLILGMRSPVFSAMFEHEMKEKNSGVVAIEDCDPETFPDFLHYIYTGTVEKLSSENAPRLYLAADKYQLLELKEECLEYMKKNISVENFCDFIAISLRHHETELTSIATQFFLGNATDILVTTNWMKFLDENVIAGNELFLKFAGNTK